MEDSGLREELISRFGETVSADSLEMMSKDELIQLFNNDLTVEVANNTTQALVEGPFFEQSLAGVVDLSRQAIESGAIYWPLMTVAIIAGVLQYIQTKQLAPKKQGDRKSIRKILQESSTGKEPDQSEINAAVGSRMTVLFAPLIWYISAISPGGLALYFASSGAIGFIQQRFVLGKDVKEMEEIADKPSNNKSQKASANHQRKKKKKKR